MPFRRTFRRGGTRDGDAARAVDEELAFHVDEAVEALVAEGRTPEAAREEALARFGDLEGTRAYCTAQQERRETREAWTMGVDELAQDLAFALRTLRRSPGYAAVVTLTLALGIAANTVIFSLLTPYFLRPLPFADGDRLVQLGYVLPRYGTDEARFSLEQVEDIEARSATLDEVGTYYYGHASLTGPRGAERVEIAWVSADLFDVLGTGPALGRTFSPGEGGPGGSPVVVVDGGLWRRRWGADPGLLGRTVAVDGVAHTVVGAMPEDFVFPFGGVRLWVPYRESAATTTRDDGWFLPVARLADGADPEAAEAELARLHAEAAGRWPEIDGRAAGIRVKPLREALNFAWEELTLGFGILQAAVLLVLAIACVNVAGLSLARGRSRAREVAVRSALGAGEGRIVRQLLTESLVLALAGGVAGAALAFGVVGLLGPLVPEGIYRVGEVAVDRRVLLLTAGVTLATPLLFGLAPAARAARAGFGDGLREGAGTSGPGGARGRRILVVAQLALAVVLVAGTGLMLRSLRAVQGTDLGFQADRILVAEATPPEEVRPGREDVAAYWEDAGSRLAALPGVERVGQVYPLPLNHERIPIAYAPPGTGTDDPESWPSALWASVDAGYFDAMGVPLLSGRGFGPGDADGDLVVVVSRSLAARHFPGGDAVGRSLAVVRGGRTVDATVVGVVGDVVHSGFGGSPDLHVYLPLARDVRRRRFAVVRASGDPAALAPAARAALGETDPDVPAAVRPMSEVVFENSYTWTVASLFLAVFGGVAVLLAGLGVYALVAWSVASRSRELGVRVAMGAERGAIRRLVLGEGLRLAAVGGALGLAGALVAGRAVAPFLYGVSPWDPPSLLGAVALFGAVAGAASLLPARRAARIDPARVLRQE